MKSWQNIDRWTMLNTTRFDIEDAAMVRAVHLIMKYHSIFKRVICVRLVKRFLMSTTTQKSIQFSLMSGHYDPPLDILVIFNVHYFPLTLS